MIILLMLVTFACLIVLGVPIAFALGLSSVGALYVQGEVPLVQLPFKLHDAMDNNSFLAVPLFIFASDLMNRSGIMARLIHLAQILVGHFRGGLAQVNIATNMLFAGISGSAMADTAAVGSIFIPNMIRDGYKPEFCVAVTAASSLMGPLIPPSIIAIIYGSMTGVSVAKLFLGGVVPGVICGIALMILTSILAKHAMTKPHRQSDQVDSIRIALLDALPALGMPVIIIGGIIGGIFTPTEASGVAVAYGLLLVSTIAPMSLAEGFVLILSSARITASVLFVVGCTGLFSWVLVREGFSEALAENLTYISHDPTLTMVLIIIGLLVLGMIIEGLSAMILVVPVLAPIGETLGYHPVQFGITIILVLLIGSITPPIGVIALLASQIAGIEYYRTIKITLPYIAIMMVVTLAVAFIPSLTTWLPSQLL